MVKDDSDSERCNHFMGCSFQLKAKDQLNAKSNSPTHTMEHWLEWEIVQRFTRSNRKKKFFDIIIIIITTTILLYKTVITDYASMSPTNIKRCKQDILR